MKKIISSALLFALVLNTSAVFANETAKNLGDKLLDANKQVVEDALDEEATEAADSVAAKKAAIQKQISAKQKEMIQAQNAKRMTIRQKTDKINQLNTEIKALRADLKSLK